MFQIWTCVFVHKNFKKIKESGVDAFESVSVMIEDYRTTKWALQFNSIFFARRTAYALIIVFWYGYPLIQTILFLVSWFGVFVYHLLVRPYRIKVLNIMMIYNEFTVVILWCTFFLFWNPISDSDKSTKLGWMWIGIVTAVLLANLGYLTYFQIKTFISIIKKMFTRNYSNNHIQSSSIGGYREGN